MNYQHLMDTATAIGCGVTLQAPMSAATTFKVGGPADLLIDLPSAEAAAQVLRTCREEGIPYLFIGNGSNLVFGDKGFRGAVLRLMEEEPVLQPELGEGVLYAPAQALLYGLDFKGMLTWIAAGLHFDFVHGTSNFLCGILIYPLVKLLQRMEGHSIAK